MVEYNFRCFVLEDLHTVVLHVDNVVLITPEKILFLVFRNNFEEKTNTSLFLLKQLDYPLSISMKDS